jgi:heat shock protein HslJ
MPTASIAGTDWLMEEIEGQPVIHQAETALRFDPSGHVYGSTGCNTFTGSATISAYNLKMSPLATTRRAFDPELMAQEQRFLNALGAVRRISIDGDGQLHLLASDDKPLARLSRTHP